MFRYIKAIATGRLFHWNSVPGEVFTDLWNKYESQGMAIIFRESLVNASLVLDKLWGPTSDMAPTKGSKIKELDRSVFEATYDVLVPLYLTPFSKMAAFSKLQVTGELRKLAFRPAQAITHYEVFAKQRIDPLSSDGLLSVSGLAWQRLPESLTAAQLPTGSIAFSSLFVSTVELSLSELTALNV